MSRSGALVSSNSSIDEGDASGQEDMDDKRRRVSNELHSNI